MKYKDVVPVFRCTRCGGRTAITDTRELAKEENVVRRCRICKECGHRMYTQERIVREADD
jgi:transcriptional regulator NrdR family protein